MQRVKAQASFSCLWAKTTTRKGRRRGATCQQDKDGDLEAN